MKPAGVVLDDAERLQWDFTPLVSVGPLRFGMSFHEVAAALDADIPSGLSHGKWEVRYAHFHLPTSHGLALTAYFAESGHLSCIAIDAHHGPQVTMDGLRLVGRVPSQLVDLFADYLQSQGLGDAVRASQYGDIGADEYGLVLRAQRAGDILLTRPVFVAREWADRVCDVTEGCVPEEEWQVYC
ncbi:hypothetical protein OG339_43450 [Streptosporangium sp. NBC_01495]|uniref:hypothetical protein n=1 Tax=Streptosporangium sp. NBC_01495 TaxID=2903899 RepID=UPI002E362904|nr:hypothetical protein [Streptosporangium sp. NBC_01495]